MTRHQHDQLSKHLGLETPDLMPEPTWEALEMETQRHGWLQFWRGMVLAFAIVLVVGLLYWLGITGFDATPLWAGGW